MPAIKQNLVKSQLHNKSKQSLQHQENDDFTPYEKASHHHGIHNKRYMRNKSIIFRSIDSKAKINRSNLSDDEKKKIIDYFFSPSLDSKRYTQIPWDDFSLENKPSVCNLQFANQVKVVHRATKSKFNSTHRKIIMSSQLNPEAKVSKYPQYSQPYQQNIVERVKNNVFVPRVKRIDYAQTHEQVLKKYYRKIEGMTKSLDKKQKDQFLPNLTQINHLQQLQKFKDCLIQYQSELKYKNQLPKMKINSNEIQVKEEKIFGSLRLKKKLGMQGKHEKKTLEPWEDESIENYSNTIDIWQHS